MTINKSEYQIAGINKLRSKEKRKISLIQNKSLDKIINKNTQKENMISPNQELLPGITAHLQRDHYKHELVLLCGIENYKTMMLAFKEFPI